PPLALLASTAPLVHYGARRRKRGVSLPAPVLRRRPATSTGQWPEQVPELLRRIYCARGAAGIDQARPRLATLLPPHTMKGIDAATALLAEAIAPDRHILLVGVFVCVGATAVELARRRRRMPG